MAGRPRHCRPRRAEGPADGAGRFDAERIHLSLQRPGLPFAAISYCFAAADERIERHAFPADPRLPRLGALAACGPLWAGGLEMLRYVPLRRFTFRGELRGRPGLPVVGKVRRASRFRAAHARGVAIARAAHRARRPFDVPAPLGVDGALHVSFQGAVSGTSLSELVTGGPSLEAAMERAGALQHAFHVLPARGLPHWDRDAFLVSVARDLEWIAFLAPATAPVVARARSALARPPAPAPDACCHGDWVPSHLLADGARTAVIDLDLAQMADPAWEIAMALAALPRDVPALAAAAADPRAEADALLARARGAWLAGRAAAGGPTPDPRALRYWRMAAEAHELALMLTKDRCDPVAFARGVVRLDALAARVAEEGT